MNVENINRDELYYFLSERLGMSSYVGIHGTAIRGDVENEYMNLSKEEKAKNIMQIGLINHRMCNLTLTCDFFGILPLLSQSSELKKRHQIHKLNTKSYINGHDHGENGQVMIVVAIPIEFQKSNGQKYFCGWIGNQSSNGHYSDAYCISDYIFQGKIPPECIYGYYTYKDKNDENYVFHYNEKYYSLLSQEEKDEFIEKNIEQSDFFRILKQYTDPDELKNTDHTTRWSMFFQNDPYEQYSEYEHIRNNYTKNDPSNIIYYTHEELETIDLTDIDVSRIKPTYTDVVQGKYNIKSVILNHTVCGTNLPHSVGLLKNTNVFLVDDFEAEVKKYNNTPENCYRYWYSINKQEFDELYKANILRLQSNEKKIKSSGVPEEPNDDDDFIH